MAILCPLLGSLIVAWDTKPTVAGQTVTLLDVSVSVLVSISISDGVVLGMVAVGAARTPVIVDMAKTSVAEIRSIVWRVLLLNVGLWNMGDVDKV